MNVLSRQSLLLVIAGLFLIAVAVGGAVLWSPYVHTLLLGRAFAELQVRYGIVGRADSFDLDLARLDVRFRGLSLAATASPDEPFFTVDALRIDVPWSAVWSEASLEAVTLANPRLFARTRPDGSTNLPVFDAGDDTASRGRLPVGNFTVGGLTARWVDEGRGLTVDVGRTTIELSGDQSRISGAITLADQVVFDFGDEEYVVTALNGQLSYDGSSMGFDQLRVESEEGTVSAGGEISDLFSEPAVTLTFESVLRVSALAARFDASAEGSVRVTGGVTGTAAAPTASLSVSSEGVSWNAVTVASLAGQVALTADVARVEALSFELANGTVEMSGTFPTAEETPGSLEAVWEAIDADTLLRDVGLDAPFRVRRSLTGSVDLGWATLDPGSISVRLRNRGSGVNQSGTATLVGEDGMYTLDIDQGLGRAVRVTGTLTGTAGGEWDQTEIDGGLEVVCRDLSICRTDLLDLPSDGPLADALRGLGGSLTASLRLGGTLAMPRARGHVSAIATGVRNLPPMVMGVDFLGDASRIELASAGLRIGENEIRGEAAALLDGSELNGRFEGDISELTDFAPLMPEGLAPSSGRARFLVDLEGGASAPALTLVELAGEVGFDTLFDGSPDEVPVQMVMAIEGAGELLPVPDLDVRVQSDELWWGDVRVGPVGADLTVDESRARVGIKVEEFGASSQIVIELSEGQPFVGELRVTSDDSVPRTNSLVRVGRALNLPLAGDLSLDARFSGSLDTPADTTVEAALQLSGGRFGDTSLAFRPASPTIAYGPDAVTIDDLELLVGDSTVSLAGTLARGGVGRLTVGLRARAEDLLATTAAVPAAESWLEGLDATGVITADASISGSIDEPTVEGQLRVRDGRVALSDHPAIETLDLQLAYTDGIVEIEALSGTWQGARIAGTGTMPWPFGSDTPAVSPPDRAATLQMRVGSLGTNALAGYLSDDVIAEIDGMVSAVLELRADQPTLDAVTGHLTLEEAALTISGVPLAQRRPTRIELENQRLRVAALDWGNDNDFFTLGGTVDLADAPVADLTVTGSFDLVALSAFTPGAGFEGQADLIADVRGPVENLDVTGTVELNDVGLRVAEPRLVMSSLSGALLLSRDTLTPFELRGDLNGGPVEITGELRRDGFRPQGQLTLSGRQIAMNVPEGLRTELDADLSLVFEDEEIVVAGTTIITRGSYREPMSLTGGLLSTVDTRQSVRMIGLDDPRPLDAVRLDIQVATAEEIVLDNNYLDASLTGDIRLAGTIGVPAVTGRVALLEGGQIRVGTRAYDIESGAIDLVNPNGIDPQLDIRARTRASSYDITLSVTGGQDDLQTSFQSDPPLPERDIVSVLLTGQTLSESAGDPGTGARDQALGLVSNELLGSAGRDLGLDVRVDQDSTTGGQVRFDPSLIAGEVDPSTRLTVAKRLSDRVQLILSQDLRESGLSWIVSYLALDNLEVRGLFSEDNDRGYELRHALEFGAPPTTERFSSTAPPARVPLRISAIAFTGSPGYPTDELLDVIRQRVGATFDFLRWQEDQDRLRRFYTQGGFLEARIRARREPDSSTNDVSLGYDIVQGPRTRLAIEGYEVPRSVRSELEMAWELSVFAGFLLEELRTITQTHLRSEGFLQARVDAEVITPDGSPEKTIEIRIALGARTRNREMRFVGNETIDDVTLSAVADAVFEDAGEWGSPELLEVALERLYRQDGMLEAAATVGAMEFVGEVARLTVDVREGPRFTIAEVGLQGVTARPADEVRDELAIPPGTPYSDMAVQEAITRLTLGYRSQGFNSSRVSAESIVDTDRATVRLVVTVREGLQEVLDGVVVEGASRTHPGLVSTALDLDIGEPIDLTEWNLARKRLYDTEVFRTVDVRGEPVTQSEAASGVSRMVARVLLEEWPLYSLQYGLRVNDLTPDTGNGRDFGLGLAADASRRNLFGRGALVGTALRAGNRGQAARGYIRMPRSFGLPIRSSFFAERSRAQRGEESAGFIEDLTTFSFEQRFQLPHQTRLTYSTNFDHNHSFEEVPSNPDFPFDITANIVRFASNVVLDRRDNLFDATRGWFHSSHVEYGFEPGEGEISFTKYLAQQYQHWSVGRGVVLAWGGRLGMATGLGDPLIPSERFFAGGGNTVRGYAQDSLGPSSIFGGAAGGNSMLIFNHEVRAPLVWRLRVVGFLDAGNVYARTRDISFADLAVGAGAGLRIDTPVGLLRLDYGFALTRDEGDPSGRVHFSIGQAF